MAANVYKTRPKERGQRQLERSKAGMVRGGGRQGRQEAVLHVKQWLAGFFLAPLGLLTALSLSEVVWRATTRTNFWETKELRCFTLGCLAWFGAYLAGWRPMRTYVFGHEWSHAVVARLFGGKIYDMDVTPTGGYVETDKTNTWITLAPYLVPFYSLIALALFGLAGLFWNLSEPFPLTFGERRIVVHGSWLSHFALGFTWCFHATFTCLTVRAKQSDLERNGEFFSLLLIFVINALILAALFVAASPVPELSLLEWFRCAIGMLGGFAALFLGGW